MGYAGPDRRGAAQLRTRPTDRSFVVALLAVAAFAAAARHLGVPRATMGGASSGDSLLILRVVLGTGVAGLCLLHWREISGRATAVLAAACLLLEGPVATIGEAVAERRHHPLALALVVAAAIVAAGLLARAAWGPPVDDRVRPGRTLVAAAAATLALAAVLALLLPGRTLLHVERLAGSDQVWPWLVLGLACVWLAIAARSLVVARRRSHALVPWLGLLALASGIQWATSGVGRLTGHGSGTAGLTIAGMLCVLWGVGRDMQVGVARQRHELLATRVSRDRAEERMREARAGAEERAHEARNALMAIEGATRTLERFHDRLPPVTRKELSDAIGSEVGRLQRIIAAEDTLAAPERFSVADVVTPAVTAARARGVDVVSLVGPDVTAFGDWCGTAQVVENLLENARVHAPGSPVTVDAAVVDERVVVSVSDRGPGVPEEDRALIFERGFRRGTSGAPGNGLGLFIARRLMEEQGGRMWVEPGQQGGVTFLLSLEAAPRPDRSPGGAARLPAVDLVEQDLEPIDVHDHATGDVRGSS